MRGKEEGRRAPITRARAAAVERKNRRRSSPPKRAAEEENGQGNIQPHNKRRAVLGDVTNTVLLDCSATQSRGNRGKEKRIGKPRLRNDVRNLPIPIRSDNSENENEIENEIVPLLLAVDGECTDESEKAGANESKEGHTDIDGGVKEDPQMCTTYVQDIYDHLRIAEVKKRPKANFMETLQKDITPNMRGILIDWLVEVSEEYKLVPDTLYLTVGYIDRFLSVYPVSRHKLQLLGVSCMLIASKYEEICPPHIEEFCYITDNTYTREEMVSMEKNILRFLHFEMTMPTIKTFLRRFVRASHIVNKSPSLEIEFLSNYLAELTLLECSFLSFLPSLIAASAVYLSLLTLDFKTCPWNSTLQHYTGYKSSQLKECVSEIYELQLKRRSPTLSAIREKYRQLKFKRVANLRPPPFLPPIFFEEDSTQ